MEEERAKVNNDIPSKSFEIFLLSDVLTDHTPIPPEATIEILFHSNHLFWDGIGCRKFVGDLFRLLGNYDGVTAGPETQKLEWGQEIKNLSPPIVDSLKLDVQTLGTEFDDKCTEYTSALVANYVSWISVSLPANTH
jgi:hypothetical protein